LTRIAKRAQATAGESTAVAGRLAAAAERDRLRACGDALYTHAHEVPPGATAFVPPTNPELSVALDPELDAKENAQRYYARYRKATDALPHLERRRETLAARSDALDVLAFEAERADAATLPELEADLEMLEGRPPRKAQQTSAKRRPPLRVERPSGARIYVGRSPRENAEITFRLARPDDLWFHARGIPGSHVVLQAPPGSPPADDDLDAAADLAATHSKARATPRVEIDYTERKYVRKQRDGAPGLVWYTNARTRIGRPDAIPGR
jgi:predicted ribosome quality control (RQC) complex YloA/Tae2 family protein